MRCRTRLLPVIAAAALALAGCGGAETGDDTMVDRDATETAEPGETGDAGDAGDPREVPESLDFTAITVGGDPFDAATLAGEPVLVWFWAEWCPRCRAAAPDVLKASEQITVLGIASLGPAADMQRFIDDTGTGALTHLADPDGEVWARFGVTAQDTYALIDAEGEVVFNGSLSTADLRERVDDLTE